MTARFSSGARHLYAQPEASLPQLLPAFLQRQRWFSGKARTVAQVDLEDAAWRSSSTVSWALAMVAVRYRGVTAAGAGVEGQRPNDGAVVRGTPRAMGEVG